jgi:hypothetical protein
MRASIEPAHSAKHLGKTKDCFESPMLRGFQNNLRLHLDGRGSDEYNLAGLKGEEFSEKSFQKIVRNIWTFMYYACSIRMSLAILSLPIPSMLSRSLHTALRAMQHRAQGGFAASVARFVVGRSGIVVRQLGCPGVGLQIMGDLVGMALDKFLGAIATDRPGVSGSPLIRTGIESHFNKAESDNLASFKPVTGTVVERFAMCLPTPIQPWLNPDYEQPKSGRFRTSPTSP